MMTSFNLQVTMGPVPCSQSQKSPAEHIDFLARGMVLYSVAYVVLAGSWHKEA